MRWPWQGDPYVTKDGRLRIPYGMKGIICMPDVDVDLDVEAIAPEGLPQGRPTLMNDNGQGGLNLVFIALAVLVFFIAVVYLVNHT